MVQITVRDVYPASVAELWSELSRLERHVYWMHDALAIEFASEQRRGVGTTFTCRTRVGPLVTRDVMRVVEWREGAAIAVEHRGLVRGRGRFTLIGDTHQVELTWHERLDFPWWALGPIGALAAAPILRRLWRANLATLGRRLEHLAT